jgi:hypothetical protein
MLANLGPFFNDLGTKRALTGEISLVYFGNGRIDFFLDQSIAEFGIAQRFNACHFADIPDTGTPGQFRYWGINTRNRSRPAAGNQVHEYL